MRKFDPPLVYEEIGRVYDFTTWFLEKLGMPQWRMQVQTSPAPKDCYADITPTEGKHVGELRLAPGWMDLSTEEEKVETLVHECLHLTHHELTRLKGDVLPRYIGWKAIAEVDAEWNRAIEMWTDHMTQFVLGTMKEEIAAKRIELWGDA